VNLADNCRFQKAFRRRFLIVAGFYRHLTDISGR
jgi:hypothetical protein